MTALLSGSEHIRPFTSQFAGSITADGQTARVAAIVLTTAGKLALLNLVANDTTLSAITATLFQGQALPFAVAEGMAWDAPTLLGRAEGVSYRLIKAPIPNTRERNYLLLPHTADIGEGIVRPDKIAPPASVDGPTAGRTARSDVLRTTSRLAAQATTPAAPAPASATTTKSSRACSSTRTSRRW